MKLLQKLKCWLNRHDPKIIKRPIYRKKGETWALMQQGIIAHDIMGFDYIKVCKCCGKELRCFGKLNVG